MKTDASRSCLPLLPVLLLALALAVPGTPGCSRPDDPAYYVQLLGSKDDETARRAVDELGRMQRKALPALEPALQSEDPLVRKRAAEALGKIRRMQAVTAVGGLLDDPDKAVRLQAIDSVSLLAQVWKKRSVELLTEAFDQSDPELVRKAGEGLRKMAYDEATDVLRARFEAGRGIQAIYAARLLYEVSPRPELAQALLQGLVSDEERVRTAAEESVKALKDSFVEPLVEFILTDPAGQRARKVLTEVREALIDELVKTLDSKRAAEILEALGRIADEPSVEKLVKDLNDDRLEKSWRVAAAGGLALAGQSPAVTNARRVQIVSELSDVLDDEGEGNRVRIGSAIALCRLRQQNGVQYLLDELDRFQETVREEEQIGAARLRDLTELRIRAQEALTASGDFVIDFLMQRIRREDAGPIIIWAAAKTLGELGVEEVVPHLGKYVTEPASPEVPVAEDGTIGIAIEPAEWESPDEEQIEGLVQKMRVFKYPPYVRWTAAIALGRLATPEAVEFLRQAEAAETGVLARLKRNQNRRLGPVFQRLVSEHEDVLFYVRGALDRLAGAG